MSAGKGTGSGRILLVGPLNPFNHGQAAAFRMLVERFRAAGRDFRVVNLASETSFQGVSVLRVWQYIGIMTRLMWETALGAKTVYITMAQSKAGFFRDMLMTWISKAFGARTILHLHGGAYGLFYHRQSAVVRALIRLTLGMADSIVVLSQRLEGMFDFDPRLKTKLAAAPNGTAVCPAARGGKSLPGSAEEPARILYLSNMIEKKGYFTALEAARILAKERKMKVRFDFCGKFLASADDERVKDAEQAAGLFDEYVQTHGLADCVYRHGPVDGEEKEKFLQEAHFMALPTSYYCEGQPISIIEAMARGIVVISTDFRAIPDLVQNGVTGVLTEYGRPDLLADAISRICADPAKYRQMSSAALKRHAERFTAEAHLDRLTAIIEGRNAAAGADN